jgi:hypothetical protein
LLYPSYLALRLLYGWEEQLSPALLLLLLILTAVCLYYLKQRRELQINFGEPELLINFGEPELLINFGEPVFLYVKFKTFSVAYGVLQSVVDITQR